MASQDYEQAARLLAEVAEVTHPRLQDYRSWAEVRLPEAEWKRAESRQACRHAVDEARSLLDGRYPREALARLGQVRPPSRDDEWSKVHRRAREMIGTYSPAPHRRAAQDTTRATDPAAGRRSGRSPQRGPDPRAR